MRIQGIRGFIGRAFGPLRTGASTRLTVIAAAALAASALYRIYLALTADRISLLTILPLHGEMGRYNGMAADRYIDASTGPLYPLFLIFVRLFTADGGLRAVFVVQGCAIVLCAAAAGIIATRLSNRTAGMAALLLVSAYPAFIIYGLVTLPVVFSVTVVFLLMLVLSADSGDGRWDAPGSVMSGILGATAFMLHPVMIFLLPGILTAVRKRMLTASIFLLLVVPWGARNCVIAGRPVPVYELSAFEMSTGPLTRQGGGWKIVDGFYNNISFLMKKGLERSHMPVIFGGRADNNQILRYAFVAVALLGLAGMIRYYGREHRRTMLPVATYALLTFLLARYSVRYRVIFEPALLIYAAILIGESLGRRSLGPPRPEPHDNTGQQHGHVE